jgi:hypothetical protein
VSAARRRYQVYRRSRQGDRGRRRLRDGRPAAGRHRRDAGEFFSYQGRPYKAYRGMGSVAAMELWTPKGETFAIFTAIGTYKRQNYCKGVKYF